MRQKDIKKEKLYTNGRIVRGVVLFYYCSARDQIMVEYTSSVVNFCNFKLIPQSLKNFARWAKMECELELQIKEE